jgi:hypothetical protein
MVGVWVQGEGPFMAGPSDSGTVHNKWLSARGDALGTMGAAAFHGAITEEIGAILVPTQAWFSSWRVPGLAQAGRPLRAGPLAGIGPSHCLASSQCRAARVDPPYAPWLATMIDRSKAGPPLGDGARGEAGPLDSEGTRSAPSKRKEMSMSLKLSETPVTAEALLVLAISLSEFRCGV